MQPLYLIPNSTYRSTVYQLLLGWMPHLMKFKQWMTYSTEPTSRLAPAAKEGPRPEAECVSESAGAAKEGYAEDCI